MNNRILVGLTLVWCAILWMLPLPIRTDIGRWDDVALKNFYGVEYGAGTSFRWSRPDAQVAIAGLGMGEYDMHLMASSVAPTDLTVQIGTSIYPIHITPGFKRYTVPVVIDEPWPDQLIVEMRVSEPHTADRRVVGVALDEVRFVPRGVPLPAVSAWLLSLIVVSITTFWLRWWIRTLHWRWFVALACVTMIMMLRRGDAVTVLWTWMIVSALGSVLSMHQWSSRYGTGVMVVFVTAGSAAFMWSGGVVIWQPMWQLLILMTAIWFMRWRRWWWPMMRPYRRLVFGAMLVGSMGLGPIGWVIAGISSIAWIGQHRWSTMRALASLGPLVDTWLLGRYHQRSTINRSRRFGLDVLRAFAISSVVIGHASATLAYYPSEMAWIPQWFAYIGVECFFVLSGWLIGGLIIRSIATWHSPNAIQTFLHRRWGRTLPPYWLMLALVAIAGWGGASWSALAPYWVFSQNIWQPHPPYFFVAWSLAVEEWFYFAIAVGLSIAVRWMRPSIALGVILGTLCVVPIFVRSWFAMSDLPWEAGLRQFVPLRLDAIAIGMLMVWWWTARERMLHGILTGIGCVGAVISVWLFWQSHTALDTAFWPRFLLLPLTTVSVALLLPFVASWQVVRHTVLHRGIQWLAYISYSLYLVHIPWRLTIEGLFGGIGQGLWRDITITMIYLIGAVWVAGQWYQLFEAPLMAFRWSDQTETPRQTDEG